MSLITYAGLHSDYTLINLGNFRPELSIMIIPMEHDISSFLDLAFVFPLGCRLEDLVRTIIFCDDIDRLTEMFWWAFFRVAYLQLPTHVVDIIHSGLSARHQEIALQDFRDGKTVVLLGTSKISAGMNFPGVRWVIQFGCDGLTIIDGGQRRGRGGRDGEDKTSTGMFFVEPKMLKDVTVEHPGDQDPGMIELLQSQECAEKIMQRHLEYPGDCTRDPSLPCCNRCDPDFRPPREYKWIDVNPGFTSESTEAKTTTSQREVIYNKLVEWRLDHWKQYWKDDWPNYGPKSLVSDSDLNEISTHTSKIFTVQDLQNYTHIVHWAQLSTPLFIAVHKI
ncbi:P-loop containing nucleoside triphosphate hydrolase protein, partial [Favolaschia claudopus]